MKSQFSSLFVIRPVSIEKSFKGVNKKGTGSGIFYQITEPVEKIGRVMRTGPGFGMILQGKHGFFFVLDAFRGLIVEIDVGDVYF